MVADFESDGGGEYEVLAPASEARRMSLGPENLSEDEDTDFALSSSSDDDSVSSLKSHESINIFKSLFAADSLSSGTSSTDDSDDDMVDENLPTLPMYYYSEDEIERGDSDSGNEGKDNKGYVNSEDGIPASEQRRKSVEGVDGGAEGGGGGEINNVNGDANTGNRARHIGGWHVNPAFYLNMEDETGNGDAADANVFAGPSASEVDAGSLLARIEALEETFSESDGGIQMKPFESPTFSRDSNV